MASTGELRSVIMRARHVIDSEVMSKIMAASQILHGERNVLRVALDSTSREDLRQAITAMGLVFEDLETNAEALSLVIAALDSYITYLGGSAGPGGAPPPLGS